MEHPAVPSSASRGDEQSSSDSEFESIQEDIKEYLPQSKIQKSAEDNGELKQDTMSRVKNHSVTEEEHYEHVSKRHRVCSKASENQIEFSQKLPPIFVENEAGEDVNGWEANCSPAELCRVYLKHR